MTEDKVRFELLKIVQSFSYSALTLGSWGNVSCRFQDSIAITPSGLSYDAMKKSDIVIVGKSSKHKPSSELFLHETIYDIRHDVNAIIHTHSIFASAFAVSHKSLPVITEDGAALTEKKIICAKYALAGSQKLADNVVKALGNNNAVFLANHGALVCGKSLRQTLLYAQLLEKMAKIYYLAKNLGDIKEINKKNLHKLRSFYFDIYSKLQEER